MKLAFLYSGNLRTLNETIENNINSFKFAEIDCYISTWDKITYTDKINSPDHIFSNRLLSGDVSYNLLNTLTYFKATNIEKYKEINFNLNFGIDNSGLGNQYYKIYDVLKLVNNINDYDALVRLRCDFKINNVISKDLLSEYIENKNIIHTSKIWYNHEWTGQKSINEMFWISPPCFINQTCGIINNVDKINKLTDSLNYGEKICYMNLEAENLIKYIKTYDFDYQILR
jgi:hypothetical protein